MSEAPDWLKLLQAWRGQGRRGGLTLPFLVGAITTRADKPEASRSDAEAILEEIRNMNLCDQGVKVGWCHDLKAPVLSLVPSSDSGLVFGDDLKGNFKCEDAVELADRLLAGAEQPIRKGNFSRISDERGERWVPFTTLDREFIEFAFRG